MKWSVYVRGVREVFENDGVVPVDDSMSFEVEADFQDQAETIAVEFAAEDGLFQGEAEAEKLDD